MFGEEISTKIPPKRRPADKKGQKKPQLPETIFLILHPTLGFQGGIVKLPLSKFQRRKEWKKKESLGKLLRNNFDN